MVCIGSFLSFNCTYTEMKVQNRDQSLYRDTGGINRRSTLQLTAYFGLGEPAEKKKMNCPKSWRKYRFFDFVFCNEERGGATNSFNRLSKELYVSPLFDNSLKSVRQRKPTECSQVSDMNLWSSASCTTWRLRSLWSVIPTYWH